MIAWAQIAANIGTVMPLERASKQLGMGRGWLRNIRRRKQIEPGFDAGLKLLRLHAKVCGRECHLNALRGR